MEERFPLSLVRNFGHFCLFIARMFTRREKSRVYVQRFFEEAQVIGIDSVFIVVFISLFLGAVSAVQTAYNLTTPFIPNSVIGLLVRDMALLELAPTITCIVLAGKVGSNIAGQLGTMRISEQIDALEVMGINSVSYLVLPRMLAALITIPLLVILSDFLIILGGFIGGVFTEAVTEYEYVYGLRDQFVAFNVFFGLIKSLVFAFLICSVSSFKGYYTRGGALQVGRASTEAVTNSCIAILFADFLLANLLL